MVDAPITLNSYVIKVPLKHAKRSAMPPVATRLQARVPTPPAVTSQSTRARKELLAASNLAAVSAAAAAHNARVNTQVHNAAMMKNEIHNYLSSTYDRRLQVRPRDSIPFPTRRRGHFSVVECSECQALTPLSPPLLSPSGGRGEPPRAADRGGGHREEVHRARRHRRREERAQKGEPPVSSPVKKVRVLGTPAAPSLTNARVLPHGPEGERPAATRGFFRSSLPLYSDTLP
jgi:hypothetical protein